MKGIQELSLRPYHGKLLLARTRKGYKKAHRKLFGTGDPLQKEWHGRFSGEYLVRGTYTYLVWGTAPHVLAHELSHVVLRVFSRCGIDPREAGGEPFCYMLSQLMLESIGDKSRS